MDQIGNINIDSEKPSIKKSVKKELKDWEKVSDFNDLLKNEKFKDFLANIFTRLTFYMHASSPSGNFLRIGRDARSVKSVQGLDGEFDLSLPFADYIGTIDKTHKLEDFKSTFNTLQDMAQSIAQIRYLDTSGAIFKAGDIIKFIYGEAKHTQTPNEYGITGGISSILMYSAYITAYISNSKYSDNSLVVFNEMFISSEENKDPTVFNNKKVSLGLTRQLKNNAVLRDSQLRFYEKNMKAAFVNQFNRRNTGWGFSSISRANIQNILQRVENEFDFEEVASYGLTTKTIHRYRFEGRWNKLIQGEKDVILNLFKSGEIYDFVTKDDNGNFILSYNSKELVRIPMFKEGERVYWTLKEELGNERIINPSAIVLKKEGDLTLEDKDFLGLDGKNSVNHLKGEIFVVYKKHTGESMFWLKDSPNDVLHSDYSFGYKTPRATVTDLIAKDGRATECLFNTWTDLQGHTYYSQYASGKLVLRSELDENLINSRLDDDLSLEKQLMNLLNSNPNKYINPAMFEELIEQNIWVRKDLILTDNEGFDKGFSYRDFNELKVMEEKGLPPIIYSNDMIYGKSFTKIAYDVNGHLNPSESKEYVLIDRTKLVDMIALGAVGEVSTVDGIGSMVLLPDGNYIVSLENQEGEEDVYILHGINFFLTTLERFPKSGNDHISSSTSNNIAGNWLGFKSLFVYH